MKRILLVNPPCQDTRVSDEDATVMPMGIYYLGAMLIENGFDVRILNLALPVGSAQTCDPPLAKDPAFPDRDPAVAFRTMLQQETFDVIGFSVTNPSRHPAMALAQVGRECMPLSVILFGGPAPTFMGEQLLAACPGIDVIVKGEGENACLELVKALARQPAGPSPPLKNPRFLEALKTIKGLIFRNNRKIMDTGPPELVKNLDTLAHPSDHFIFQHVSMSRGCPGKCTFCGSPKFWAGSDIRFHSPQWVARELITLAQKGVEHFFISDDTFTMDKQRVIEFCRIIIEKRIAITWNAISRVDYIDRDILFWMRRAGCVQISFGVESGAESIKKTLGKPLSNKTAAMAFSLTRSMGIMPRAYFIYGSPGETRETIQESVDLITRIKPLAAVFYMLVIFPGTHLYQYARQKGWVEKQIWDQKIEDLPWFELDPALDFDQVKSFGDQLRKGFYTHLDLFASDLVMDLDPDPELFPFHADFLSRLGMTFLHGDYSQDPRVKAPEKTAQKLFQQSLAFHPDLRAFMGLGMLFQKQRNFEPAVQTMKNGLAHFPGNPDLTMGLGVSLMNLGRFDAALTVFTPFGEDRAFAPYLLICKQKISG